MNILIVEDIDVQRRALVQIIKAGFEDINIYSAENATTAIKILEEKNINLFILDINLEGESGIDLAKKIREYNRYELTGIVFITSEIIHLLNAFKDIHCYDYLVKPYNEDEISRIINVFLNHNREIKNDDIDDNYTFLNLDKDIMIKLYHRDIIFIEYCLNRCKVHTKKNIYKIKGKSLSSLVAEMDSRDLVQSHKSYVININHINAIIKDYEKLWSINFHDYSEEAKLGYTYKNNVLSLLERKAVHNKS
ncbi:LytR/AlgR family response regulator transcription factor [Clostridium gasigenes]|uniref:LytR/AlgR family response regulator transcription factor n=1 Tax=Clostridium gasigenes TaxID=94869 RepID=UPI001C0DF30D|nr:LytTR family DNA-binding domain-containing protein [Clostridium gasigenes]MBU3109288.1 LytTR family DNA-binding domain-containing protein [Clostridium gasigenes]